MGRTRQVELVAVALLLILCGKSAAGSGRIEGRVRTVDDRGLPGVVAVLEGLSRAEVTGARGEYTFARVPAGSYRLTLSWVDDTASEMVEVTDGATTQVETTVDWEPAFAESITVYSASRRNERVFEAPA